MGGNFVAVVDDLTGEESEEISTGEFTLQPALSRAHVEVAVGKGLFWTLRPNPWVAVHDRKSVRMGAVAWDVSRRPSSFEVTGHLVVPRVMEGRPLACPQCCPEGP
ncbi:MAG: hypothetical protein LC799_03355 [Actinobacteria bacterium]|nr:hypothetical protein [Actinomycetota bacterium]